MKDEVKVCLIGSGRAGMIHGHNFAGSVPGGKIIAVCDPVGDVAENAAKELGIDLFLKTTVMLLLRSISVNCK